MFDYLCMERCRGCGQLIEGMRDGPITTCLDCWRSFSSVPPTGEFCSFDCGQVFVVSGSLYCGVLKKLLYRFKYDDDRLVAGDLVCLLTRAWHMLLKHIMMDVYIQFGYECQPALDIALIPIPLYWWRRWRRGFNQSEILAQRLCSRVLRAEESDCRFMDRDRDRWERLLRKNHDSISGRGLLTRTGEDIESCVSPVTVRFDGGTLFRCRSTRPHHGLGRAERMVNVRGAFAARQLAHSTNAIVKVAVLIDDIYTSGATIAECSRVLLQAGWMHVYGLTIARAVDN